MQMRLKMSLVEGTSQAGKSQIDRKKVGKRKNVCRWAATMLKGVVMSVALLGTVSAARAGTWAETSRVYDGEDKRQIGTQPTQTTPWYPQGYGLGGYAGVFEYPSGQSGFVSRGGTITSTWTWSPRRITDPNGNGYDKIDDPSDALPDELILKVYTRANATAASNTNYPSSSSYRDTTKETVSASVTGDTEGAVTDNGSSKSALALAIRLVKVPTNGSRTVSLVSSTQATATVMGNRYPSQDGSSSSAPGYVNVGIGFSIAKDTRGVRLSRPGAIGETFDASTNTTYGDSTYAFLAGEPPTTRIENPQTFNASVTGFNPSIPSTWIWAPGGNTLSQLDTWNQSKHNMPLGSPYLDDGKWKGAPSPPSTHGVSYTATDSDGATAIANYELRLHDEIEKTTETVTLVTASGPLWGSDPNSSGKTLNVVHGFTPANTKSIGSGNAFSSGWTFVFGGETDLSFGKIQIPLGISAEYNSSQSSEITSSTQLGIAVPSGFYVYPMFQHTYNRHFTYFRHFTPPGEHKIGVGPAHPDHYAIWDQYVGGDILWSGLIPTSVAIPVFDPADPPAMPANPDSP